MRAEAKRRLLALLAAATLVAGSANADPAAWRIAGSDGGEIVLLGSMHLLRARDYPLPAAVDRLVDRAETVVMEVDLDDGDLAAQQRLILEKALLPQGTELADVVDAELYGVLEQGAAEAGIDLELLTRFEPWFLAISMLEVGMRKVGFEAERGIEQYVLGLTRADGKEVLGLETLEFQIGIFDAMTPELQREFLAQTLTELEDAETTMNAMSDAWRAGELETLSGELLASFEEFPGLYDTLVTERNEKWVGSLEDMLDDRTRYLVVVGALHLVGDGSVIDLLEARGHPVQRIH
ncbi:MAG TPA: TraB/GumN family protein [Gammaproteobacteria bacterium]|nr:TraB/GumN family protein [Gammaproteobacteria bacterium]